MKLIVALGCLTAVCTARNITARIIRDARADEIDLFSLTFAEEALTSIQTIYDLDEVDIASNITNGSKVDVHSHVVPPWYRELVPFSGQSPTPSWSLEAHIQFMASAGIKHSVLSVATPGSVVFSGSQKKSTALARLLNEYLAALTHKLPDIFSFFAVIPLPYTLAAIKETTHASTRLNAAGVGLQSNHEGSYPCNRAFTPFFAHLNNSTPNPPPIFIHPSGPCLHSPNGSLTSANPTPYPEGLVEFCFETARAFMDLTLSRTLANFTALPWIAPHGGGAFPSILDRFLTSQPAELQSESRAAFAQRVFWDAAGPVFPNQIRGLLAYGVPAEQLVYGSDFPYAPNFTYAREIAAIDDASFLTADEKAGLYAGNSGAIYYSPGG